MSTSTQAAGPHREQIRRAIEALHAPDAVIELRALHKGRKRTDAGYFDAEHRDQLIDEAVQLNAQGAAVYVVMNALDPQLLARHANRIQQYAQARKSAKRTIGAATQMNGWTRERRKRQAAAIHRWKPWHRSKGPKTTEGRAIVARNAYRGATRPLLRELARVLREQRHLL